MSYPINPATTFPNPYVQQLQEHQQQQPQSGYYYGAAPSSGYDYSGYQQPSGFEPSGYPPSGYEPSSVVQTPSYETVVQEQYYQQQSDQSYPQQKLGDEAGSSMAREAMSLGLDEDDAAEAVELYKRYADSNGTLSEESMRCLLQREVGTDEAMEQLPVITERGIGKKVGYGVAFATFAALVGGYIHHKKKGKKKTVAVQQQYYVPPQQYVMQQQQQQSSVFSAPSFPVQPNPYFHH